MKILNEREFIVKYLHKWVKITTYNSTVFVGVVDCIEYSYDSETGYTCIGIENKYTNEGYSLYSNEIKSIELIDNPGK